MDSEGERMINAFNLPTVNVMNDRDEIIDVYNDFTDWFFVFNEIECHDDVSYYRLGEGVIRLKNLELRCIDFAQSSDNLIVFKYRKCPERLINRVGMWYEVRRIFYDLLRNRPRFGLKFNNIINDIHTEEMREIRELDAYNDQYGLSSSETEIDSDYDSDYDSP